MSLVLFRERDGRVARVVLDRPELRNAFDEDLVATLTETFLRLAKEPGVRAIVLEGRGKAFCAGADLSWMKKMAGYTLEENLADAERLAAMFEAIDSCPRPVVARIQGAALGGGTGLAAVSDIVVAEEGTLFGTTEVRLGIVPAVISPYLVRKIGESAARYWFTTGERFDAQAAARVGLVHTVVPMGSLDAEIERLLDAFLSGGPEAVAEAKRLATSASARAAATSSIAARRVSAEGQEGLRAFLEKRKPVW